MSHAKGAAMKVDSKTLATDLRKSHFTLGQTGAVKTSEYIDEYRRRQAKLDENLGEKLALKSSHFQLGNYSSNKMYSTVSHLDYIQHQGAELAQLNEEKKRDLRTHHFSFGNYKPNYVPQTALEYTEKAQSIEQFREEQDLQRAKMRKHYHDFNETDKKNYTSVYGHEYNRQFDPKDLRQGLTQKELQQKVVDLRKSHVVLGGDNRQMISVQKADYKVKEGHIEPPANDNVAIRRTNFVIGTDAPDFYTVNSQYFVKHPVTVTENFNSLGTDLRATHFIMGKEQPTMTSVMRATYQKPEGGQAAQTLNPALWNNHFSLGEEGAKLQNKTTYSTQIVPPDLSGTMGKARDQSQDRGSNFKIGGTMKPEYITETKANYQKLDGKPADFEASLKADLRGSHFKFDDVQTNQFKTVGRQDFTAKEINPNRLHSHLLKDLRSNHWNIGNTKAPMAISANAAAYRNLGGQAAALNPDLAKDLRTHHFVHGHGKWILEAGTEYKTNYDWKMPSE